MTIKIEQNITIPEKFFKNHRKYPWLEMEIGESFFVPKTSFPHAAGATKRYAPRRFTTRREKNGIRVWRIK